jgi:hypothetical protein
MAPSRKMKRGKMSRRVRRGKKATRRMRRRQSGGGEYVLTFAGVPTPGGPAPEGLADLGTYTGNNQGFTIDTTKPIHDIKIFKADGVTELGAGSFGTNVQTKITIKVGAVASLVPSSVTLRGATKMSPAAPKTGAIVVRNLNASTLALVGGGPQGFVVKVTTA